MTASWRLIVTLVVSSALTIETAALICVPFGLSGTWLAVVMAASGPLWACVVDWGIGKTDAGRKALHEAPRTSRGGNGDGTTLLALFAMREGPVRLFDVVIVLSPEPNAPSWLHPMRRWNVMSAWARRNAELAAEAGGLAEAGLLRCVESARTWYGWDGASVYEATGLGRDVAARNAEVLMAGQLKEEA